MENIKNIFLNCENRVQIRYPRNSTLFIAGSPISGIYYLVSGKVKLSTFDSDGKEIIVKLHSPQELIGHRCFFSKSSYGFTATILEESEIIFLERNLIGEELVKNPGLSQSFLKLLGKELEEADNRAEALITKNVGERLAQFILNFVTTYKPSPNELFSEFHLTREEVASIIGTSSETVTRYFTTFKEKGFLEESNKVIHILNPEELRNFSCH